MGGSNAHCSWRVELGIGVNVNNLKKFYCNHIPVNSPNTLIIAKRDSRASHHYWSLKDSHCLTNITPNTNIQVTLSNSQAIPSTIQGDLSILPYLSHKAQEAIVLPDLSNSSLISLDQLYNDDCDVYLSKKDLKVYKQDQLIITWYRNQQDSLWHIPVKTKL